MTLVTTTIAPAGGALVTFRIGNTHTLLPGNGNVHEWECYCDVLWTYDDACPAEVLVPEVTFKLHPTFRPPEVLVKASRPIEGGRRYSVKRKGWGAFDIAVIVHLHGKPHAARFAHELRFEDNLQTFEHEHTLPIAAEMLAGARRAHDATSSLR